MDADPSGRQALTEADLGEIEDNRLRRLLAHWLSIRGDRLLPRRRDLDPSRIGPVLPIIWLLDHVPECGRFRYRIAGDEIRSVVGFGLAGRYLDEVLQGEAFHAAFRRVTSVMEQRVIAHCTGLVYLLQDRNGLGERLVLPLSDDGERATGVVGATAYSWTAPAGTGPSSRTLVERYIRIAPAGAEPIDRTPAL